MARNFTDVPIYVAGIGQGSGYSLHAQKDLTSFEATRAAAKEAYEMSGLTPQNVQFAEVHDCFSIAEIIHMEIYDDHSINNLQFYSHYEVEDL